VFFKRNNQLHHDIYLHDCDQLDSTQQSVKLMKSIS